QLQLTLGLEAFEVVQAADAQADRLEVGQETAQPAVVDEWHVRRLGHVADRVSGCFVVAHEQHGAAAVCDLTGELLRSSQQRRGLEQVDDVDAAALTMDEAAHLGVPAARLVAEVDAGLQQLRDAYLSHGLLPLCMRLIPCGGSGPEVATVVSRLRAGSAIRSRAGRRSDWLLRIAPRPVRARPEGREAEASAPPRARSSTGAGRPGAWRAGTDAR